MTAEGLSESLYCYDESNMYHRIKSNCSLLDDIVNEWIQTYKLHKKDAYLTLIQLFINSSGCKGRIIFELQTREMIHKLAKELDWQTGKYPIIMTGQEWKEFRANFCNFLQVLIRQCNKNFIIDDNYLLDNLILFLIALSESEENAFRHTSTLAAVKIMSALVDIASSLDVNQDEYLEKIENMLFRMFKMIYLQRFDDTLSEIRALCLEEILIWIEKIHQFVLDDKYLKFIESALVEKEAETRIKCLRALQAVYREKYLNPNLEKFISKFKTQIVVLTLSNENLVAVEAVELALKIAKHQPNVLTSSDRNPIYDLVFESNQALARAAGKFLNEHLYSFKILAFFCTDIRKDGAFLVDSLIDTSLMMKDWKSMTDLLLLEEMIPDENSLTEEEKSCLIYLMVCSIKQTATGKAPIGRESTCKVFSATEIQKIEKEKKEISEYFSQTLPFLLDKYSAESDKLEDLIAIPQYFDLDIYNSSKLKNLDSLLNKIQIVVENSDSYKFLDTAAETLQYMCTSRELFTRCDIVCSRLIDAIVKYYVKYYDDLYAKMNKGTLEKAWKMDQIKCALSMQRSLQVKFESEIISEKGKLVKKSQEFTAVKQIIGKRS
ncbi:cohesin subunit SA-1-like isoform X2 [Belonocnema kinseyi]|uniref:cohesin subunit SA-1-like isoform X2 n=1 Tax=Belonocnema kinseyi TaxID=2817044 RepID=UPI00143D3B15|nr:cohesin subunit SA-1-like isoform X2 [Belonocnema kinseyi]